jgi:hypothetical protein
MAKRLESGGRASARGLLYALAMRNTSWLCVIGLSLLGGCIELGDSSSSVESGGNGDDSFDRDACKIEDGAIGDEGVVLRLGTRTVTFHDWVVKSGSNNEYVGFSISLAGTSSVGYIVKSGGERDHSTALTWLHAAGPDGGSQAPAISHVDFCEECEDGSCDDGGGGGDEGGGDGCIECGDGGDGTILL